MSVVFSSGSLLRQRSRRLQHEREGAQQQRNLNIFQRVHCVLFSASRPVMPRRGRDPLLARERYAAHVHFPLSGASLARVWSVIQFTSQVLPPSSEKDCSKWGVPVLSFDQSKRTKTVLPLIVSWV